MSFYIGQRVKRVGQPSNYGAAVGTVGTVVGIAQECLQVHYVSGNLTKMEGWWLPYCELVKPETPAQILGTESQVLPEDSAARKKIPLLSGLFNYFQSALVAVAKHSYEGNEKHNPGQEIHWARGKSDDHLDAALRHIMERDLVGAAWRILAALQLELESKGAPKAPGAR